MTAVDQVVAHASRGDALTDFARELRDHLPGSALYALSCDAGFESEARALDALPANRAPLVVHTGAVTDELGAVLQRTARPIVLVHHGVVPEGDAARSRRLLGELMPLVVRAFAVSGSAAAELQPLGYTQVEVVSPVFAPRRLVDVEPRPSTLVHFAQMERPIVAAVAPLRPEEHVELLAEIVYVLETYWESRCALLCIGAAGPEEYWRRLRGQIRDLALDVHFTGPLDDPERAAAFRSSVAVLDVGVTAGFSAATVDAMALGVPVVTRVGSRVATTAGDAAIVLDANDGPTIFAEALARIIEDEGVRSRLVAAGRDRVAALEAGALAGTLVDALAGIA